MAALRPAARWARSPAPLLLLLLAPAPAAPQAPPGASSSSRCRCDCCEVQPAGTDALECALIEADEENTRFLSPYRAQRPHCGALCAVDPYDSVLQAAESSEVDFQRFCFYECRPGPGAWPGGACVRLGEAEQRALAKEPSGNARGGIYAQPSRPPAPALKVGALPPAPAAFAASGESAWHHARRAGAVATAPWDALKESGQLGLRAEEAALIAQADAKSATTSGATVQKLVKVNGGLMPSAITYAETAAEAAREAHSGEEFLVDLDKDVREQVIKAARDVIGETLSSMKAAARAAAKEEGAKKGKALYEKMKEMAPKASAAAMIPWNEAKARAGKFAGDYVKAGDAAVAASSSAQMDATIELGGANMWNAMGEAAKAQKMTQQAHMKMNLAAAMNGAANANFNAAKNIVGTIPAYDAMALQAAYHDAVLWDPDWPPPPVSPVLLQEAQGVHRGPERARVRAPPPAPLRRAPPTEGVR